MLLLQPLLLAVQGVRLSVGGQVPTRESKDEEWNAFDRYQQMLDGLLMIKAQEGKVTEAC